MPSLEEVVIADKSQSRGLENDEQLPWPLTKLRRRIAEYQEKGLKPLKGLAVLLTTGGMNPVHRGHVQLLHQARAKLEAEGFGVAAAFLSPSHDKYLQPKARSLGTIGLSAAFRIAVAREAVKDDSFVSIGSWESDPVHSHWPDFPEVAEALQSHLSEVTDIASLLKDPSGSHNLVQVFYACGADHANKCGLYRHAIVEGIGTVVVPRDGERTGKDKASIPIYVADACKEVSAFSSTKVRKAIAAKDFETVSTAMSPSAARFLLQPSAEELSLFKKDYQLLKVA